MIRTLFGLVFAAMLTFSAVGCNQPADDDSTGSTAAVSVSDGTTVAAKTAEGEHEAHATVLCGHCGQDKSSDVCCKEDAEKCDCGMAKGSPLCCKDLPDELAGKDVCSGCGHAVAEDEHHHCDKECEKCDKCGLHAGAPACCKLEE